MSTDATAAVAFKVFFVIIMKLEAEKVYKISKACNINPSKPPVVPQRGSIHSRMFHRTTICRGDNYTGKNFVTPIKTRSPVVNAVKLMAWRQAKSPSKITT